MVVLVDRELDAFIERRARQSEDDRRTEEAWKESIRVYNARRREENRALWFAHFCRMAASHARLAEDYERRAERLCEGGDAA